MSKGFKLCIAEKPSVAKEIANVLGAKERKDGYFEGSGYQVSWTFGHFCTLKEPHDYQQSLKSWSLIGLPILPERFGIKLIENTGVAKQFNILQTLLDNASEVINCGDAGQEGELIQRWVLAKAKFKGQVKRLWISSLTKEAIKQGFENLLPAEEFDKLYEAGSSRAIGDWLLGINATRAYTLKYGQGKAVLSIGRVQTPTLALIVNRDLEILNFNPEPFWELKTKYRDVVFSATSGRFKEKENAQSLLNNIVGKDFTISSFEKKEGKELPPSLFDLTSLQVECNKKFGFSAEQTLNLAQSLYEKKYLTYPRVDTTYLPMDIYPKVDGVMRNLVNYKAEVTPLLGKSYRKIAKVFNDKKITDHHAIIPTNVVARDLRDLEFKVYDLVVRRFLAVFYPDCIFSKTQVDGEVEKNTFRATGKQILEQGWRLLFKNDKQESKSSEEQLLPNFEKGESGAHLPELLEKSTQAPKYFTEGTLLRAMETAGKQVDKEELREVMKENGIGRPSTRANIIETLFKRKYILKKGKSINASPVGIQLIQTVNNELLKSVELTGLWEAKLRKIEKGELDVKQFLSEMKNLVSEVIQEVKQSSFSQINFEEKKQVAKKIKPETKDISCPKCKQGLIRKGKTAFGCSEFGKTCDFKIPFKLELMGKVITDSQIRSLLNKGKTSLIKGFVRNEVKLNGVLVLDSNQNIVLEEVKEEERLCPACKSKLLKGKTAYGCSEWKSGCAFRLPFVFYGKELTDNQITALLMKGKTPKIKGLSDPQTKEKMNGFLVMNENHEIVYMKI